MKTYSTTVRAISIETGELTTYGGPRIRASCWKEAEEKAMRVYGGYVKVIGELVSVINEDNWIHIDLDNNN